MGGGGNGADKAIKEQTGILGKMRESSGKVAAVMGGQTRWWGKALKTMGIQVGVAGILKQSQIFTSTLGAMFQIFGAMVDVLLAPWLPVIIPMIRWMARGIPKFARASEVAFDWAKNKAWPNVERWVSNLTSTSWWGKLIYDNTIGLLPSWLGGPKDGEDPGKTAFSNIRDMLPSWLGGKGSGGKFPEIPFLSSISEKLGSLGPIVTSIAAIAGVLTAAKVVRYFTAFAKHIPVIGNIFKPFHILTRFIDEIAHLSIRLVMPGRMLSVWDEIVNTLYAVVGKAKPRKIPPGILDAGEAGTAGKINKGARWKPPEGYRAGAKGSNLYRSWAGMGDDVGDAARFTRTGTGGGGAASSVTNLDDATKALRAFEEATDLREAANTSRAANVNKGGPARRFEKAKQLYNSFNEWVSSYLKSAGTAMKNGKITKAFSGLVKIGISKVGALLTAAKGTKIATMAGRLVGKFARFLPGIGAGFILADTGYSLKTIKEHENSWFGDVSSPMAHLKEAAGIAWRGGELVTNFGPGMRPMEMGPLGNLGERIKNTQREEGSVGAGKFYDAASISSMGATAALTSFVPGVNVATAAAFEATKYAIMGGANPNIFSDNTWIGGKRDKEGNLVYPERDVFGATGDQIMGLIQMFKTLEAAQNQPAPYGNNTLKMDIQGLGNGNMTLQQPS
jgi:hypothetical protein